ncbi:hypothetical protein OSB04_023440 [Centaurea solstitialis]|uniref:Uncharacterized protein n=1 Tax=Centaurea solstitialis TaxID=347529 RepID=A0AA38SJV6_9ASTR|nr:hypothetical protein OSB04_023440 [Centaurea solstitialis]
MTNSDKNETASRIHPAQTVNNIRNLIPLTLDTQKVQYHSWVELFQVAARAHCVLDHIDGTSPDPTIPKEKWQQLDAIVLSWIYGTISEDLLLTILKSGSTAREAWLRIKNLFHDNKSARAADLEQQFIHTKLDNFSSVSSYCQHLKMLSDQLSDVDQQVSDQRLVLQLINGLTPVFDTVGSIISQLSPLPSFDTARSIDIFPTRTISSSNRNRGRTNNKSNRNTRGSQTSRVNQSSPSGWPTSAQWPPYYWGGWALPPCPYPTTPACLPPRGSSQGLLGPAPRAPQAFFASPPDNNPELQSTALPNAFSAMTLQQPEDTWYMDTGASSHMTSNPGNLRTFFKSSNIPSVCVGDGFSIPVAGSGMSQLTSNLTLSNVLYTPQIIKNLVSVRQFTTENNVSLEFDHFGFSVKDLPTGHKILRCNSSGNLYPVHPSSKSPQSSNVSLAAISSQVWHHRLGHPGDHVLSFLRNKHFISCNKEHRSNNLCQSCQIAKSTCLTFSPSVSPTYASFDIIHSDLWTSPVLSTQGFRYYLVLLDDFTHFVWNWNAAMHEEYNALIKKCTWDLVPRPPDANIIRCMWLFKHKHNSDGSLQRYKARLVVKGKSQQVGVDCAETFSPVVKPATIQTVLSIALSHSWPIHQLDVKNAFLHGDLVETVYMHQPPGFVDPSAPKHVCLLRKSLYGLKQAPRAWYHRFSTYLAQIVFSSSKSDQSLQYLTFTRPDISYAIQQICLHMHAPREPHLQAMKRILWYISGTLDYSLHLSASSLSNLVAYSDADWGGCPDTRRSTSGYCVFLGDSLLSWSSKRQPTLSRSSAESEYRGVANAVAETSWLRNLLLEHHFPLRRATIVYCDNVSAVYLSSNPVQHQRTKHVEMDIHFVREKVALGQVRVLHVPSSSNYADIFTKGLPSSLFMDFRSNLTVRPSPVSIAGA